MADATVSKTVEGNFMWVRLPPSAPLKFQRSTVGAWLSLVERSVRVAEVGGSNPLAPTIPVQDTHRTHFDECFVLLVDRPQNACYTHFDVNVKVGT